MVQVEVLCVFRTTFVLRSEKLHCRCNLLGQDRVRVWYLISSATIVILDFVLVIILSNTQHLGSASNSCGNALSSVLEDRHWVLLRVIFPQKG